MNCIVTAGPTYEPLDAVRRLTNFSTGKLGSDLANFLTERGHRVTLLKGYYSVHHEPSRAEKVVTFSTTSDLASLLRDFAKGDYQVLFHAAAVSDFSFGNVYCRAGDGSLVPVQSGKFSTRQGNLLAELVPTQKIIAQLRDWYPKTQLVGWKFEVDGGRDDAIEAGVEQMRRCRSNACVVNGKAYGDGFGLLAQDGKCSHVADAIALFNLLERLVTT